MRILDRYIGKTVILTTLFVVLVMLAVWSFLDFIQELSSINVGHYGINQALIYVIFQLPNQIYQFFPIAALVGCLLGLGRLARSSQLVVMRAAGVSVMQLTWAVVKAVIIMLVLLMIVGEWLGPVLQNKARHIKAQAMGSHYFNRADRGVWLNKGNHFIKIGKIDSDKKITDVEIYAFQQHRLVRLAKAKSGYYKDGRWYLHDVRSTQFAPQQIISQVDGDQLLGVKLPPKYLLALNQHTDQQTGWQLQRNIEYRHANGLVANTYQLAFWQRLVEPITTIVLICLSIPFMLGSLRRSSMGSRLLIGILIGFVFYMMNRIFGPMTLVYQIPPVLAALLPTGFFLTGYFIMLKRIR